MKTKKKGTIKSFKQWKKRMVRKIKLFLVGIIFLYIIITVVVIGGLKGVFAKRLLNRED